MKRLSALLLLVSLQAFATEWVVNKDHSELFFSVPYLNVSEVTGRFAGFKGSAVLNDKTSRIETLDLNIASQTLSTENKLRDGHLKAPDFLNVAKYPEITFTSSEVVSQDGTHYSVKGDLSLHGKTVKKVILFELSTLQKDSWGYDNRFAKFDFTIDRTDFGLVWNKTIEGNKYLVGDKIRIWGALQLQPLHSLTPGSKHYIPVTSFTRGKEKLKRGEISREEFEKLYMPEAPIEAPVAMATVDKKNDLKGKECGPVVNMDFRDSFNWWVAMGTLGLLGFFAAIILGVQAKNWIAHLMPKYKEEGFLGNASDILVIAFTLVYAMAYWYVGWGH